MFQFANASCSWLQRVLLVLAAGGGATCVALGEEPGRPQRASYGTVELLRDEWGIPHVFSDTDAGALYGLGRAVAQDRGFQMHYNLRMIQGRLAEVVGDKPGERSGETAVLHDRRMRTFGFYRAARALVENGKLDSETLALLEAYCAGVNDWFAEHANERHPLFAKLELRPETWTPADCIASLWQIGQFFASDGIGELATYRDLMKGLRPLPPTNLIVDDTAAVVGREDVTDEWLTRVQRFHEQHRLADIRVPVGAPQEPHFSHAWVVGGKKTTTGGAVLVSDPQTPVLNPSLWYEFHVSGKQLNARGVGVPGSPGIMIGWNSHFAWGVTALGADQADLFRLKTSVDHPDQYSVDGQWRKMELLRETIMVKGGTPVELQVRQTHYGPVVTSFANAIDGDPEVALKRVPQAQTDSETIQGLLGMMRAKSLSEFTTALAFWHFPSANLIFGDREGNIGYWVQAAIPVRSRFDAYHGAAAVDGSESRHDWQGFVPHELLPHTINPPRGWIASGNHRPVASFYPIRLGPGKGSTGHTLRSWRLYERLTDRDVFQPEDVLAIHFDTVNPGRRDMVMLGFHLRDVQRHKLSDDAASALRHLEDWQRRGSKSDLTGSGAGLAGELEMEFRPNFTPLAVKYGGGFAGLTSWLTALRTRLRSDPKSSLDASEQEFVERMLAAAWKSARERYGNDPAQWDQLAKTSVLQTRRGYYNSLNAFGSLDPASDLKTPALTCVDGSTIKSQTSQSYTQYVPLHDVDSALSILPPGHSEQADSTWRTSTWDAWAVGKLHPAPLSRAAVEKIAQSREVVLRAK